jgi:hypothetical protein
MKNVNTKEIPRDQWESFLEEFSRDYEGQLVSVQVYGDGTGSSHVVARNLPFGGAAAGRPRDGDSSMISVMVGTDPSDHVEHIVTEPCRVRLESNGTGQTALHIDAVDGSTTVVRFR